MSGWELVGTLSGFAAALVILFIYVLNKISDRAEWRGKVDSDRTSFKKFMKEIREDIQEIRADIKKIFERLPRRAAMASSPMRLTDLGKEIAEAIDAKAWAANLALTLTSQLEGNSPYKIQETARDYCMKLEMNEEQLALCGNCAYEKGVSLDQVKGVLGLELRDILLEKFGLPAPE